jgi:hypothetical protein
MPKAKQHQLLKPRGPSRISFLPYQFSVPGVHAARQLALDICFYDFLFRQEESAQMPGFGQLLKTTARELAPSIGHGRFSWKPTCINHARTEYMICQVVFRDLVSLILLAGFCAGEPLTPDEAVDQYLTVSCNSRPGCSDGVFAVQIDASLPNLEKQGSMSGLKVVSRTGKTVYNGLRFTGDNLVKTAVIARFLANDMKLRQRVVGTDVTRQNYSFAYIRTSEYNGVAAYVFRLTPMRKRTGLFRGELWLDAGTAAPFRLWGDFVKSPSFFVRKIRFVQDYQHIGYCFQPLRLLITAEARMVGKVEMAVWLHPIDCGSAAVTAGCSSTGVGIETVGQ